jgi:hypothetical protein
MKKNQILSLIGFSALLVMGACKKQDFSKSTVPPAEVHFTNATGGSFYIQNVPNSTFKIPIGITSAVNADTKVVVTVSSPTGAAAGVQYNLPSTTVTIPAGKTLDSLPVQGIFAGFPGTRRDTLVFKITASSDLPPAPYNDTYKLVLQKYCTVDLPSFSGNYTNSYDIDNTGTYGPYTANISNIVVLTPTTGKLTINNFSAEEVAPYPISPITVNIDWTDPSNFKVTIPTQILSNSNFYGYGPLSLSAVGASTFSSCSNTFTLNYSLNVSAGTFGNFKTTMAR